jgi:hypothetical protein
MDTNAGVVNITLKTTSLLKEENMDTNAGFVNIILNTNSNLGRWPECPNINLTTRVNIHFCQPGLKITKKSFDIKIVIFVMYTYFCFAIKHLT